MLHSDQPVCGGGFKFPMQVGNRHTYERWPWPNGEGHSTASCEVMAAEKVIVPAGSFDAVRVECSGFWNRVFEGTSRGRQAEVYWYAPKISRQVKYQYRDWDPYGSTYNRVQTELLEFVSVK